MYVSIVAHVTLKDNTCNKQLQLNQLSCHCIYNHLSKESFTFTNKSLKKKKITFHDTLSGFLRGGNKKVVGYQTINCVGKSKRDQGDLYW